MQQSKKKLKPKQEKYMKRNVEMRRLPHATTMWQGQIKLFVVAFPVAEVVVAAVVVALIKQTFCQRHFVNRIARGAARPNRGTGRGTT